MRLRIRYAKLGKVRFISHRDTARAWERAMRRADLPVATSRGFTPRLRLSFGLALPTGAESDAEYLDVELTSRPDDVDHHLAGRLTAALPIGMAVGAVVEIDAAAGSLQEDVVAVRWELSDPAVGPAEVAGAARRLLEAATLPLERTRKGERRTDDVRPQVLHLSPAGDGREHVMVAELATVGRGLRPAELAALAFPHVEPLAVRVLRTHQWMEHDGIRREVVSLPGVVAAPAVGA